MHCVGVLPMADMAESRKKPDDTQRQEDSEDTVLSMVDVLQENEELEEEATAVLGDSDDKYCTYPLGYRGRQALYACATCTSASTESAGLCLACSYECHEGHQLYELYTKRNFRCDCGNSKFGSMQCKLIEKKDATNTDNKYNQNFRGVYCICSRPYPDPDDEIEDEMIQCVVCEDWYHGRHLGEVRVPDSNDYQEMVCAQCMQGPCDFLWYYAITGKEVKMEMDDSCLDVEVEKVTKTQAVPVGSNKQHTEDSATSDSEPDVTSDNKPVQLQLAPDQPSSDNTTSTGTENNVPLNSDVPQMTREHDTEPSASLSVHQDSKDFDPTPTRANVVPASACEATTSISTAAATSQSVRSGRQQSAAGDGCQLRELRGREVEQKCHATFWPSGWRSKLCTCQDCKTLYDSKQVSFLMDEADTVLAYELRGKVKHAGTSQYQMGMEALTTLNRVQQVEVIHEYNDLKSSLRDYLQSFANQGKVVKRQDIDEFFSDMQSRKRQRVGVGNPQYFCR